MRRSFLAFAAAAGSAIPAAFVAGGIARPDHVVIVIEENHDKNQIVGTPNAPYINSLISSGLYYSNSHGTDHDSQPNYMELFSGANPGVQGINSPLQTRYPSNVNTATDAAAAARENGSDAYNTGQPFNTPNLGSELLKKGFTFTGYSESQPTAGFTDAQYPAAPGHRLYVEKHNPWAQFQGSGTNQLPASTNQPLTAFSSDFSKLSTVSIVVPNESNDMHDTVSLAGLPQVGSTGKDANGNVTSDATTVQNGDNWLKNNLGAYQQWAQTHNSLLIVTTDEDDFNIPGTNNIATLVSGDPNLVKTGVNTSYVNHFNLLRTVEDMYGVGHAGLSADVPAFDTNSQGQLIGGGSSAVPLPNAALMSLLTLPLLAVGYRRMRMLNAH